MKPLEAAVQNVKVIAQRYALKVAYDQAGNPEKAAEMLKEIDEAGSALEECLRVAIRTAAGPFGDLFGGL